MMHHSFGHGRHQLCEPWFASFSFEQTFFYIRNLHKLRDEAPAGVRYNTWQVLYFYQNTLNNET